MLYPSSDAQEVFQEVSLGPKHVFLFTSIWPVPGWCGTKYEVSNELIQPNGLMSGARQSVSHSWATAALKAHTLSAFLMVGV